MTCRNLPDNIMNENLNRYSGTYTQACSARYIREYLLGTKTCKYPLVLCDTYQPHADV